MRRVQQGVMLIELMMVALIISVLVTVAQPVYQGYVVQAKNAARMLAASACHATFTEVTPPSTELPAANDRDCEQGAL